MQCFGFYKNSTFAKRHVSPPAFVEMYCVKFGASALHSTSKIVIPTQSEDNMCVDIKMPNALTLLPTNNFTEHDVKRRQRDQPKRKESAGFFSVLSSNSYILLLFDY